MKIAQVAPLYESCPPQLYGGTERVVSYLTEALVDLGHEVSLFASGDSRTAARLVSCSERALRLDEECRDPLAYHAILLNRVDRLADSFDFIHFHTDYLHFPLFAARPHNTLTTLHGRLDLPDLPPLYREFRQLPLASISDHQRLPLPWANWQATIHHGLPRDLYSLGAGDGGYLAFLGRISPEKRPDRAIAIAKAAGIPLKIAAKVDKVDEEYFKSAIEPLLADPLIEFIGEIGDAEKGAFLGGARALLFPIAWPEPFGLVVIEAMATGTPVVGFRCGSVAEVLEDGVSGIIVDDVDEAVARLPQVFALDRHGVRRAFENRFSAERMALNYVAIYEKLLEAAPGPPAEPAVARLEIPLGNVIPATVGNGARVSPFWRI